MTREDAAQFALTWVAAHVEDEGIELCISETLEKPYGWYFSINSCRYFETGLIKHGLFGLGPVIVLLRDQTVHLLNSRGSTQEAILEFERDNSLI